MDNAKIQKSKWDIFDDFQTFCLAIGKKYLKVDLCHGLQTRLT